MKSQKKKKTPLLQFIFLSALLHLGFFAAIIAPSIKTADYGAKGVSAVMVSLYPSGGGGGWGSEGGWGGGGSGKNIRNYITLISDSIKRNIYYPVSAWRSGIEGKVLTSFLIETDGKAKDVRIKVSSGSTILDRCALKIIEKSLPLPAPPLKGLRVEVPLVFSLKDPPKAALPKNL